jgi:mannose-6-phosphate isomerase
MTTQHDPAPYPFRAAPTLKERVWGGRGLAALGKYLPDARPYGESWEVADLPEGFSCIDSGPLAGQTLEVARQLWGAGLVGPQSADGRFPLLIKYIDAEADLSVQVHPGPKHADPASEVHIPGAKSKDESWLILDVRPGGAVLVGFVEAHTHAQIEAAIRDNTIAGLLLRREVEPGELLHIKPGTVHAICAGVTLLEIQQPSDTTYRVYDYERPGTDGKPRPLHIAQAIAVMDTTPAQFTAAPVTARLGAHEVTLRHEGVYTIAEFLLAPDEAWEVPLVDARPQVVCVLEGALWIEDGAGGFVLEAYRTGVVPSACGGSAGRAGANGARIIVAW